MVFESMVSDLLNRFIGDYVENLDKSQLKIGIWGGNVVLENLKVKENALSEFNVPFKVKAGQIGKLTLKIPWKNLYNDAVVATLEGLYLLVVPGATLKYDAVKEERYQQEAKQKELQRIEEALLLSAQRASQSGDLIFSLHSVVYQETHDGSRKSRKGKKGLKKLRGREGGAAKPQEEKKDTFLEKLATQVIKNLQVKISSIHIRYEDDLSDPQCPLSVGVTLSELSLQTADENWKPCILNEAAKIINKLCQLESLSAYWNVNGPMIYRSSHEDILEQLKSGISSSQQQLSDYNYILRPIFAFAKMIINPNAEMELTTPKLDLHLEVQNINMEMNRGQYLSMLDLLESVDCMVKNAPYRKFRPCVPVHTNSRLWWRYAFNSILEVHVRRLTSMWLWSNIWRHRQRLKAYKVAYKSRLLSSNKISVEVEANLQELEKVLDVFNITLARQQAKMEVIRSGQKVLSKKGGTEQKKGGGFFSGWFGRKAKKEEHEETKETQSSGLDEIMTLEEKEKLYTAIGYSGSSHNLALPKQYIAVVVSFQLQHTSVTVREIPNVPAILEIQMIKLSTKICQRPGAQALRVEAALQKWSVTGLQQDGKVPALIASVGDSSSSLLTVLFELNPENSSANQLLRLHSQPVEMIYDALTVNSVVEFFRTGRGVDLEVLTSATLSKLEEIKEKTAAGLSHIIETRKVLDLRIDLKPSYLLVPMSGFYSHNANLILIDFGSLQLSSVQSSPVSSSSSSLEEIMDRAYERFDVELKRVQVLYSKSGKMWKSARLQASSLQHILQPLDCTVHLAKCMVDKDSRMPRFKVAGELPLLHLKISDKKIQSIFELVNSIPLPNMGSVPSSPTEKVLSLAEGRPQVCGLSAALLDVMETDSDEDVSEKSTDEDHGSSALEELTDLHMKFEFKEVLLELMQQAEQETTFLTFRICQLGAEGNRRTYDLGITSYLGGITLGYCGDGRTTELHLISSSLQQSSNLLKVEFIKADPDGPNFQTIFNNTEQMLKVEFSSLDFQLHTKALLSTISFLNCALSPLLNTLKDQDTARKAVQKKGASPAASKASRESSVFSFKLCAVLGCFHVEVCDDHRSLADIKVQGIDASVQVQAKETEVFTRLRDIVVQDVSPGTIHKKAVSIMGEEVFSFKMSLYPRATEGNGYTDMSLADGRVTMRLGCIRIIYLHKFLMSLLMFVDHFQTAKEALSAATTQAAEKAVSGVRDLAQKSFRLSLDIKLKAPLIIVPQSSTSQNAIVVDLGLITVTNSFSLMPAEGCPMLPLVEKMDVRLTQLKLSRIVLRNDISHHDVEILQPISFELLVTRNLSASWFTKIPGVQVQGVLRSLQMSLGEEDLGVLMKTLVENIGEGSKEDRMSERKQLSEGVDKKEGQQEKLTKTLDPPTNGEETENTVSFLLKFEIKEGRLTLKKQQDSPYLVFHMAQLGIDTKVRKFDMCATTYIKNISLTCLEFKDSSGEPLCLISSLVPTGGDLLKVQYFKANRLAPTFTSTYKNTEQMMNVTFTSLDFMLHMEALLSSINFLSAALSVDSRANKEVKARTEEKTASNKFSQFGPDDIPVETSGIALPADSHVINLKVMVTLGAVNVLVCDQKSNIAEIKIQGINGSLVMQGPQIHVSARLQDLVVLNVDPKSLHKKAISIVGDEVFSFAVSLTPTATKGAGYTDMSQTDGRIKMNVGCIQVVYLHKFFMSLLNFSNNFQMAKEALSTATAQAAEKAASSVRDLAQKSYRLSLDTKLKAPLIIVPQSTTSQNALVMDLGLITVRNSFSFLPIDGCSLPAIIDNIEVQLSQLKVSRTNTAEGLSSELLEPVNLGLNVRRNGSAAWFDKIPALEVDGCLRPMRVALSQEDLKVLLLILMENLAEASSLQKSVPRQEEESMRIKAAETAPTDEYERMSGRETKEPESESVESVRFSFNIESLGLVLFQSGTKPQLVHLQHQQDLRLGGFMLQHLKTSGRVLGGKNVEMTIDLMDCTLDDLRTGHEKVTSRMVGRRDEEMSGSMIEVRYHQDSTNREVTAVLQKLYVCASVEFLMAVAGFFLQAMPQSSAPTADMATSDRLPLRQTAEPRRDTKKGAQLKTRVQAVVVDPEVMFVASLMKADAPALVAMFQSEIILQVEDDGSQSMKAELRDLSVLACPFIRNQMDNAVTTVLRPCSVTLETNIRPHQPLIGSVSVEEIIVKVSPFIINTVMTITAAMTPKPTEEQTPDLAETEQLWSVENIYDCNFWFLGVDQAMEITESYREPDECNRGESFSAEVKVIQVTLESGLGHQTVPLLLSEFAFTGAAKNWSSLLEVTANVTLEVNYFNEVQAVWEPLIERVDGGSRRWNLQLEMKNNPVQDKTPVHGDEFVILPEPRTAINICSKDTMNITVSKCSLNVFQNLSKAFSEGAASTFNYSMKEKAPFTIRNSLGIPLILQHSATLRIVGAPTQGKLHELGVDQSVDLEHSSYERMFRSSLSALQRQESCLFNLSIVPTGYSEISNIAVDKPGRRLYNVRGPMLQEAVSMLLQVDAADGNKVVTVRSPLQIKNHFLVPFTVLRYCSKSRSMQSVGQAEPEMEFHVSLEAYRSQLFVRPAGALEGQYDVSSTCISWKEQVHRSSEVSSVLQCPAMDSGLLPLIVSTVAIPDELRHIASHGEDDWDPAYVIHLHPMVTLRNLMPYTIRYMMELSTDSYDLFEGSTSDLVNASISGEVLSLVLVRYQGQDWHGHLSIKQELPEFFSVCLTCETDTSMTVDVNIHVIRSPSNLLLTLFSPYWIINKTSRVLQYQAEDISVKHPADYRDVILFSFRKKALFRKNKIQLRISTSSWSESFSLDTVGSYGCVRCPAQNLDFLVGISIGMSSFNLTRIVTMSPFYTLVNKTSYELEVGEVSEQAPVRWHYVASMECLPLWPENNSERLCLRVVGSDSASNLFFLNRQDSGTLLRLDMVGGIIVDVNVSDSSTVVSFSNYYEGAAPALIVNHTPWVTIKYRQSGSTTVHQLDPGQTRRFAWDEPTCARTLTWSCMTQTGELDLLRDESGQFSCEDLSQIHWVSFLDGRQRVVLFTEDLSVVAKARQAEELEQFEQEVKLSLQNLGLSLVNNNSRQEIAYIGITSSGVVWEMKPKNRWKPLSQKTILLLEKAYQSQLSGKSEGGWLKLAGNLEVNLSGAIMMMRQPHSCQVRRNFLSGITVEFKQSQHQKSLRAQLHWFQVDNQMPGAIFPIIFHPVPPPKSIALDSEPKPFIDLSIITRFNEHSNVMQVKYFMALVQEMAVKVDQGFLGATLGLFSPPPDLQTSRKKSGLIEKDLQQLQTQLMAASLNDTSQLSFFEHFHISPIKLHLSLSLGSSGEDSAQEAATIQSFNLLLKSIGATLTDVDDLVFKLAFFEVKYQFYQRDKLMWAVIRHYSEQFLRQMYVLVLGLDVLGNPFGLIRGLSEGVEAFFYEPFQGAVQGPEEFAEGLVIGVRSLLGHTVGGAAGMVSKITGSVGKGLAAITMDKEYQQKRREEMNRPPKDFGESLAKGGKGLLKGFVGGVTGIVTNPVEGAKKEGAAGFFKGIGKGLVGVVARPTGGIVDMASSTFQGIQRVAESTEEVTKLRPGRLIREDGIIRPYDLYESQGFDLFQRSVVKKLDGEVFRKHSPYPGHRKSTIIVTNRRVLCVKEIDFVNHFNKEWECLFDQFYNTSTVTGSELKIYCKEQQKLKLPKKEEESVRRIQMQDAAAAQALQAAILEANNACKQHHMVRQKSTRFLRMDSKQQR